MSTTIQARLAEIEIQQGADYVVGKPDSDLINAALNHYAEYLDRVAVDLRWLRIADKDTGSAISTFQQKATQARELRDIFQMCFELVAHGVGEG
jgi:hypothetical protein